MNIESIIGLVPAIPKQRTEEAKDIRTELYLLYREGDSRADFLCLPFGENLSLTANTAVYLRFANDKADVYEIEDPLIKKETLNDKSKYITIEKEETKLIIPYLTKIDFPKKIMPNSFTEGIAEANERFLQQTIYMCRAI